MNKKILALDVGSKRIGVAISDELGLFAHPLYTIHRKGIQRDISEIKSVISQNQIGDIVIGLPKNMDGTVGFQGEKTYAFAEILNQHIDNNIIFWDERLSTKSAKDIMLQLNIKQEDKKNIIDTIAAVVILDNYLNSIR